MDEFEPIPVGINDELAAGNLFEQTIRYVIDSLKVTTDVFEAMEGKSLMNGEN